MNEPGQSNQLSGEAEPMHYYPDAPVINEAGWGKVPAMLRILLSGNSWDENFDWDEFLQSSPNEGIVNFASFCAMQSGITLPRELKALVMQGLVSGEANKLSGDYELNRIFSAATARGLRILLIKGEGLARTIYPAATCRPSGDFDMLIEPGQLELAENTMRDLGYQPGTFEGVHMSGQRTWRISSEHQGRPYVIDLHWDLSNRRWFRSRVPFDVLFSDSQLLPLDRGEGRIPSEPHSLLIACVHLAAANPDMPVHLRWLLDLHLLQERLDDQAFEGLMKQCGKFGLLDVLAIYCGLANRVLGPTRHQRTISRLAGNINQSERQQYKRSCEQRYYDFYEYGKRLKGWGQRMALLREAIPYSVKRIARR